MAFTTWLMKIVCQPLTNCFKTWFEPIARFMCYPFREMVDVDSHQRLQQFHLNTSAVEKELMRAQADVELKSKSHWQFGNLLTKEKYPNIRKCSLLHCIIWLYLFLPVSLFLWGLLSANTVPPSLMIWKPAWDYQQLLSDYATPAVSIQCSTCTT